MYQMFVSSQDSHVKALTPNVAIFADGASKEVIRLVEVIRVGR